MGSNKAVRSGTWKLCVRGRKPPELYNLANDLGEKNNLAKSQPDLTRNLMESLAKWEADMNKSARMFQ